MADHIRFFYAAAETEKQKMEIRSRCPQYFEGDKLIDKKGVSPAFMINNIKHFPEIIPEAKRAQVFYDIFSKFEHNGHFTSNLLYGTYGEESKEKI